MIIYLSQGTQKTQNTQMNADLYFFSANRRSPISYLHPLALLFQQIVIYFQICNLALEVSGLL